MFLTDASNSTEIEIKLFFKIEPYSYPNFPQIMGSIEEPKKQLPQFKKLISAREF
jgi:hypothetical protein